MSEAQDAFIIFDEAYEGTDVDAFYLGESRHDLMPEQRHYTYDKLLQEWS